MRSEDETTEEFLTTDDTDGTDEFCPADCNATLRSSVEEIAENADLSVPVNREAA